MRYLAIVRARLPVPYLPSPVPRQQSRRTRSRRTRHPCVTSPPYARAKFRSDATPVRPRKIPLRRDTRALPRRSLPSKPGPAAAVSSSSLRSNSTRYNLRPIRRRTVGRIVWGPTIRQTIRQLLKHNTKRRGHSEQLTPYVQLGLGMSYPTSIARTSPPCY